MLTDLQVANLYQKHFDGMSVTSLAKEVGLSTSGLNKIFARNGLEVIRRNYPFKGIRLSNLVKNQIDHLYEIGQSISEISEKTNICSSQVWRVLQEKQVDTQKTSFNYRFKIRKYDIDESYFSVINTAEKAYILGFLFADGNAHSKYSHIKLKLQESDRKILEDICSLIGTNRPIYFHKKTKETHQNQCSFVISNKIVYHQLINHGIVPNKTFVTDFPYRSLTEDLYHSFIRGYFDGDGCLYYDSKRNTACWSIIGSSGFCQQVAKILLTLGVNSYIAHDHRAKVGIDILRVRKRSDILKICGWMYQNSSIHLVRKFEKFEIIKEKFT